MSSGTPVTDDMRCNKDITTIQSVTEKKKKD